MTSSLTMHRLASINLSCLLTLTLISAVTSFTCFMCVSVQKGPNSCSLHINATYNANVSVCTTCSDAAVTSDYVEKCYSKAKYVTDIKYTCLLNAGETSIQCPTSCTPDSCSAATTESPHLKVLHLFWFSWLVYYSLV